MSRRKTMRKVVVMGLSLFSLCLIVIYSGAPVSLRAQGVKKTIVRPLTLVKEPVEITFEHRGQPVKANEGFEGDSSWVRDLRFKLKNKADRAITFVLLDVDFPETVAVSGRVAQRQIPLGHGPDEQTTRHLIRLRPGESMEIRLADSDYDDLEALLERQLPLDSVTRIVVRLHQVMFDDDTLFSSGEMYRRNPSANSSPKWVKIDQ